MSSRTFPALPLLLALVVALAEPGNAQVDLSGRTDASIRNVISLVAHHQVRTLADGDYTPCTSLQQAQSAQTPVGITWSYPWGVTLYGVLRASEATHESDIENFALTHNLICGRYYAWEKSLNSTVTNQSGLSSWQNSTAIGGLMSMSTSSMDGYGAMGSQMMEGILRHSGGVPGTGQGAAGQSIANTISTRIKRLSDGTFARTTSFNGTLWADDLYMGCGFLVRWAGFTNDTSYLDDAARQVINFAGYLQDTNGLYFHGYFYSNYFQFSHTNSPVKWGRANGWAMVTTIEVLSALPANHPLRPQLLDILRRHIEGIKAVQAPDGMWRQILDDTNLWEETSCTGMFAYSIARAVNRGWIDPTNMAYAHKAFVALAQHVRSDGVVIGTCEGTNIGTNKDYYIARTQPDDDLHGRGPVMLAGAEILLSTIAPPPPALALAQSNGQTIVTWPVVLTNYTLDVSSNLANWNPFGGTIAVSNGWQTAVEPVAGTKFYRIRFNPPPAPAATNYEAESLARTFSDGTVAVTSDSAASGSAWVQFDPAVGVGSYIEFTIPNLPAGSYDVQFFYKKNSPRGQLSVSVDGTVVGGTIDELGSSSYASTDCGVTTLAAGGSHLVRLTITGKSASSSGYRISADKFAFVPQ
jgi:unsaturated rhamnogalacturonyl hydrolase